jgi:hypothetical protein
MYSVNVITQVEARLVKILRIERITEVGQNLVLLRLEGSGGGSGW